MPFLSPRQHFSCIDLRIYKSRYLSLTSICLLSYVVKITSTVLSFKELCQTLSTAILQKYFQPEFAAYRIFTFVRVVLEKRTRSST